MPKLRTLVAASLLLIVATHAHAGFLTGFVVGAAMSSGGDGGVVAPSQPMMVSSDHTTIFCRAAAFKPGLCFDTIYNHTDHAVGYPTPAQWAAAAGYTKIYKTAVVFANNQEYLVMEVSK